MGTVSASAMRNYLHQPFAVSSMFPVSFAVSFVNVHILVVEISRHVLDNAIYIIFYVALFVIKHIRRDATQ